MSDDFFEEFHALPNWRHEKKSGRDYYYRGDVVVKALTHGCTVSWFAIRPDGKRMTCTTPRQAMKYADDQSKNGALYK